MCFYRLSIESAIWARSISTLIFVACTFISLSCRSCCWINSYFCSSYSLCFSITFSHRLTSSSSLFTDSHSNSSKLVSYMDSNS